MKWTDERNRGSTHVHMLNEVPEGRPFIGRVTLHRPTMATGEPDCMSIILDGVFQRHSECLLHLGNGVSQVGVLRSIAEQADFVENYQPVEVELVVTAYADPE